MGLRTILSRFRWWHAHAPLWLLALLLVMVLGVMTWHWTGMDLWAVEAKAAEMGLIEADGVAFHGDVRRSGDAWEWRRPHRQDGSDRAVVSGPTVRYRAAVSMH